jgi:hypothetical protein
MVILSLPYLMMGVVLAGLATKRGEQQAAVETVAGRLPLFAFVLIASCLPVFQ